MEFIHQIIVANWILILVLFVLLSLIGLFQVRKFKKLASNKFDSKYINPQKIKPQYFTGQHFWKTIDKSTWRHWSERIISDPLLKKIYRSLFIIDDVWALMISGLIYLLANIGDPTFSTIKLVLLSFLILAYLMDFIENKAYYSLKKEGGLVDYLPIIGTIKWILFMISLGLAIYVLFV